MQVMPDTRPQTRGYSYRIASVTALSGFLFGFDTAIINGAIVFLRRHFQWTEIQTEFAAGSLLAGCALGAASRRHAERPFRPQDRPAPRGGDLCAFLRGDGAAQRARRVCGRAGGGRCRHRYRIDAGPALYRGGLSRGHPRAPGQHESTGDRIGHSGFVPGGLGVGRSRRSKLAMDVRRGGRPLAAVLRRPVLRAGEPALAGEGRQARRSGKRAGEAGRTAIEAPRDRQRNRRGERVAAPVARKRDAPAADDRHYACHPAAGHGHQHGALLRVHHLHGTGGGAEYVRGAVGERSGGRDEPGLYGGRTIHHRPAWAQDAADLGGRRGWACR